MDFVTIFLALFLSFTLLHALFRFNHPKNLPPGPPPLPVIGNLHLLGRHPHRSLSDLSKIHGPIMSLKLGRITTLVISSAAAAKQVLQKQDLAFSGHRHVPDALHAHNHFQYSVVFLPVGARWRSLRKILNSNFFSAKSLDANQHLRRRKVQELVAYCRKAGLADESVDVGRAAFRTTLNVLSNTIFSKDLTDSCEDSGKEFKELVRNIMVEAGRPNLVDFFPALKRVDPQGIRRRTTIHVGKILELFDGLISERLKSRQRGENDDVLEACLKISDKNPGEIDRIHIDRMFLDLFIAGTDTTSSTLEWAMAEVLRNPHIMANAKEELNEVIGNGKILEERDVSRLPYLQGIMKETLRLHPPAPFLVPRNIKVDIEINGYTIPKDTQVLINIWDIGRDPVQWADSLEFKPERFLTSKLDVQGQDFELIPFGAGRRICPGLPLAIRMLPVMLGSLLNNFNWKIDGGIAPKELDMTEKFGLTLQKADPLRAVPMLLA